MREVQLGVHHEVEAAERFIRFVDAMDEVEQLQRKVDEECVEQVLRNRVHTAHVDWHFAQFA